MSVLSAFTTQLDNLGRDLHEIAPHDKNIKLAWDSITFLKRTNPRKLVKLFKAYIHNYRSQIMNKDADFFITHNYSEFVDDSQDSTMLLNNIKAHWHSMSDKSKESVWLYLQVLIKLSDKC